MSSLKSSKKTRKKIGSKALKEYNKNLKSLSAKSKKYKSHISTVLNKSQKKTQNNIYRYRIMSTIFNKDENVYYPYYIPNISPNLIIDLEPKQDIIVTNDLIKYFNENIKSENVVNKSMTNPGCFQSYC